MCVEDGFRLSLEFACATSEFNWHFMIKIMTATVMQDGKKRTSLVSYVLTSQWNKSLTICVCLTLFPSAEFSRINHISVFHVLPRVFPYGILANISIGVFYRKHRMDMVWSVYLCVLHFHDV